MVGSIIMPTNICPQNKHRRIDVRLVTDRLDEGKKKKGDKNLTETPR